MNAHATIVMTMMAKQAIFMVDKMVRRSIRG